jgi:serine/threonine protein kinase
MGEVFLARARGAERVQKTVVLKRMRGDRAADDKMRARFVEEARVAVSLSHPHIVPVFEFGELDGEYFLVMEWLRGGNLAAIAGHGKPPLSWAATALVGSQICDALAYVHNRRNRQGAALVHGDVTPRNVLLSTDGHVLLADFGLARFAPRGRAGTVRFLAPEQARGEAIDGRADLYALALVLAEAITGQPVYDADPERAARQARAGAMPDLTGCDPELAQVLRRALASNPSGRFRDAAQMREAFDALLDREPRARVLARRDLMERTTPNVDAPAGDGSSRMDPSAATRDATALPRPRRWPIALTLGVGLAAGSLLALRGVVAHGHASTSEMPSRSSGATEPVTGQATAPPTRSSASAPLDRSPSPSLTPRPAPTRTTPQGPALVRSGRTNGTEHRNAETTPEPASSPALLDVNATPWARVRIDGQSRGETPILNLSLPAGTHRIELVNEPLGIRRELLVTLKPGERAQRIVDLNNP